MLTYGIGDALGFHFFGFPVFIDCFLRILLRFPCMELCVRHFMDSGLCGLRFAHALFNGDRAA